MYEDMSLITKQCLIKAYFVSFNTNGYKVKFESMYQIIQKLSPVSLCLDCTSRGRSGAFSGRPKRLLVRTMEEPRGKDVSHDAPSPPTAQASPSMAKVIFLSSFGSILELMDFR